MNTTFTELMVLISATPAIALLFKTTVLALIGLVVARLLRQARASVRHLVLASTFAALVLAPVGALLLPTIPVPVSVARAAAGPSSPRPLAVGRQPVQAVLPSSTRDIPVAISATTLVSGGWAAGAVLCTAPLLAALWQLRRLRRTSLPWLEGQTLVGSLAREAGITTSIAALLHEKMHAPVTSGVFDPVIILPADAPRWSAPSLRRAIVHELEHIRRGDWWMHLAARAICAAYWFNPFVWLAYRQLALEAERACDDAVMEKEEGTQYAEQLVALARRLSAGGTQPALAMAARSDLARRVSAVLDERQARGRAGRTRIALVAALASTLALALAPLRTVASVTSNTAPTSGEQGRSRVRVAALDRALVETAESGDVDELKSLLDAGAQVDATVVGDGSALIISAREGHLRAVSLLLDRGADPNLGVPGDGNPLIMAAREGHLQIVELLLNRGANIDQVVDGDENALIQASGEGRLDVVKLLVAQGANVHTRIWADLTYARPNGEWRTPLSMARRGRHRDVEAYLLSAGARE